MDSRLRSAAVRTRQSPPKMLARRQHLDLAVWPEQVLALEDLAPLVRAELAGRWRRQARERDLISRLAEVGD